MTEVEKKIEEIEEQIKSLKKEKRELKKQLYSDNEKSYIKRMFSRLEIQVRHNDTLLIYCNDDDGFRDHDEIDKFMDEVEKEIVNRLGSPKYYTLRHSRERNRNYDYYRNPYFRVLIFNPDENNNWNNTLDDIVNKIKIQDNGESEDITGE